MTVNARYIVDDVDRAMAFYGGELGSDVEDLGHEVHLQAAVARFRNEIVEGRGGKQVLAEDPAGNPIELFEPK